MSKKARSDKIPKDIRDKLSIGYSVHFLGDKELINFQETLDSMPDTNRIIVFDDVSFLSGQLGKKEMDTIKSAMTTIRHTSGGEDIKTVIIFCYHYQRGLDKYLRDTVVKYFTSVRGEEIEAIQRLVGKKNATVVNQFRDKYNAFSLGMKLHFQISNSVKKGHEKWVTYKYGDPFRLALFYNNSNANLVVYPSVEKLVPDNCSICNMSKARISEIEHEDITHFLMKHYGKIATRSAINYNAVRLFGVPIVRKNIKNAHECLQRLHNNGVINLRDYLTDQVVDSNGYNRFEAKHTGNRN